jgi:hypothetical protein
VEDPLQPEKATQFAGLPAAGPGGIHPTSNGYDPGNGVLMDQQEELWICRAMDKSRQICPQHLDNSGELSIYQQHDDDEIYRKEFNCLLTLKVAHMSGAGQEAKTKGH